MFQVSLFPSTVLSEWLLSLPNGHRCYWACTDCPSDQPQSNLDKLRLKASGHLERIWTVPLATREYKGKIALIIGNEGKGISSNIKKQVDEMITIPMNGHVQSLNASVAAAILMWSFPKPTIKKVSNHLIGNFFYLSFCNNKFVRLLDQR